MLDTVKHIKISTRTIFDYYVDEEVTEKNPIDKVKFQKRAKLRSKQKNRNTSRFPKNCATNFLRQ